MPRPDQFVGCIEELDRITPKSYMKMSQGHNYLVAMGPYMAKLEHQGTDYLGSGANVCFLCVGYGQLDITMAAGMNTKLAVSDDSNSSTSTVDYITFAGQLQHGCKGHGCTAVCVGRQPLCTIGPGR